MKTAWGLAAMDNDDNCTTTRGASPPTNDVQIHCTFGASDPLVPFAPNIDWDYTVTLSFNGDEVHYDVSGCHDGFPSHELYINGVPVMTYSEIGHTVWELFPLCDVIVDEEGDVQ